MVTTLSLPTNPDVFLFVCYPFVHFITDAANSVIPTQLCDQFKIFHAENL